VNQNAHRFIVLTGGPGSGKTSVIDALQHAGYSRTLEAGRAIIQDQVAIGGRALPWQDRALFAELMLSWEMASYHIAERSTGLVFFDRSVVDLVGYLRLCSLPLPTHVENAVRTFRYNSHVFIAPPWKEIYEADQERKQDFPEAVRTYHAIATAYTTSGYELIEIPRASVDDRARFILSTIKLWSDSMVRAIPS
jgi:predicted ATPase